MHISILKLTGFIVGATCLCVGVVRTCSKPDAGRAGRSDIAVPGICAKPTLHGAIPPPTPTPSLATGDSRAKVRCVPLLSVEHDLLPACLKLEAALAAPPTATGQATDRAFDRALADFRRCLAAGDDHGARIVLGRMLDMAPETSRILLQALKNDLDMLKANDGVVKADDL